MNRREAVDRMIDAVGVPKASAACKVAAVLFSYRCTMACRHCCFGCAGDRPAVVMSPRQCLDALALLHETGRVVHIAGGECMLFWDALAESLDLAAPAGLAPHFIETNCSFATSDGLTLDRLRHLAARGVRGLLASADPYHQEFAPAERFLRVRRLARQVFGEQNFYGTGEPDEVIRGFEGIVRDEARLRDYVRSHPPVMVGTAHRQLSRYLDDYRPDDPQLPARGWGGGVGDGTCAGEFRAGTIWELHIDPYGNVQTNCGMVLGVVPHVTPAGLLAAGPERANRFVEAVCRAGPLGLARLAEREYGFVLPDRVTQGCELCFRARTFLRAHHPDVFGPAEVYAD
ncbi:MAG: hypothetical protein BWZ02_01456 [Lentisphaerae bacterium ADurb.BinA184]|nr:MAG: hypothetical protein BWZ02_01456 [Lentisphaerae bacterium ADurb.BinA184]